MRPGDYEALAIGGSAGSLALIQALLAALPGDCAPAVVVCMHTGSGDTHALRAVLARDCRVPVVEAIDGAPITAGRVHVAAGGYHLLVERDRRFALCAGERVNYVCPSIDLLFETMAEAYRTRLIGVLLSGANDDGAAGLAHIHALGGHTRVQAPETASASAMPAAALALFTPHGRNSPEELCTVVRELSEYGEGRCDD